MVDRDCPVCGTHYKADPVRLKHGRQTTCSSKCSYLFRSQQRLKNTTKPCAVCGKPVTRTPSQETKSKAEVYFCSRECHYRGRSLGYVSRVVKQPYNIPNETRQASAKRMRVSNSARKAAGKYGHTEATKRLLSQKTAAAIAEGRHPRVSQLEKRVGALLDRIGVRAMPQYPFRDRQGRFGAVVDFYLPDLNVALEVNGTFWHTDPRVYPKGPEHPSQRQTATRYARKIKLLESKSIQVIEVWELDFKSDPEKAVREALATILHGS